MVKPAQVRYYFDEDILRLAHTVARLRADCTYPGDPGLKLNKRQRPPCSIAKGSKDWMWLPVVTEREWLIVTRDHNMRENPAERRLVRETGARMVALSGQDSRYTWDQLELLMLRWKRIEGLLEQPGPFIYLATRNRFKPLDLEV